MRVTSALWVAAFVRRCFIEGAYAVIEKRGAEEAGAIFVLVDCLDGSVDLYGPAPQAVLCESSDGDRLFQKIIGAGSHGSVKGRLDSERRFDPDLWIVTVEVRGGKVPLETVGGVA